MTILQSLAAFFGIKSSSEVWRDCILAEARSRGLKAEPVERDGYLAGYNLVDPSGEHEPMFVSAYR